MESLQMLLMDYMFVFSKLCKLGSITTIIHGLMQRRRRRKEKNTHKGF